MKSDPWAKLAAEAAGGSHDAFAQLYRAFWSKVLTICRHYTENDEDARDATQMTFINVHRFIHTFKGQSRFSTWLHRVARNEGLTIIRKNKSRALGHAMSIDTGDLISDHSRFGQQTPDRLPLLQAFDCLTPHQLHILKLHLADGYTYEEISAMLGISVTASKSVVHQARLKITAALGRPTKEFHARKKEVRAQNTRQEESHTQQAAIAQDNPQAYDQNNITA